MNEMIHLKIEQIGIAEISQLQKISKETFIETFGDKNSEENMQQYLSESLSLARLTLEIENPNSQFYFAFINNNLAGYLKLNFEDAQTEPQEQKTVEIERIYILKEFQGKKIGQALLQKAFEKAHDVNAEFLWLAVWEENTNAIGFYKKNNFQEFGTHVFQLGKDAQTDILMKVNLNA
jgi:diamine N-acetyltransferase